MPLSAPRLDNLRDVFHMVARFHEMKYYKKTTEITLRIPNSVICTDLLYSWMSAVMTGLMEVHSWHVFCRETLLGQLQVYLKTLKDDFNVRTSESSPPTGKNLPEVVNNIVWVRQLEAKVRAQENL